MAAPLAARSFRLAYLLNRFGVSASEAARQDSKALAKLLRIEYHKLAQEKHPDKFAPAEKEQAADGFVQLHNDFSEAIELIEAGVSVSLQGTAAATGTYQARTYDASQWQEVPRPFQPRPVQEFDGWTRAKGHMVLWTGLFTFFYVMREFLVWSAGSTGSWYAPSGFNPFWVRRFKDDWTQEGHKKVAEADHACHAARRTSPFRLVLSCPACMHSY
eukprot:TRINITY_DN31516_c0_g1_i5.p1 TRINITY_DN31516_c0_g1~~TRINITY_DN31516_c0_g1_i5.p1  ORF type:complete len:216 (+),score=44.70 TRINITY_DN31516_c0_g1_i5:116-763(+)